MTRAKQVIDGFMDHFSSGSYYEGGQEKPSKGEEEKAREPISLPIMKFYSVLEGKHRVMLAIGFFASFAAGLLMPSIALVMGNVTGAFDPSSENSIDEIMGDLLKKILAVAMTLWFFGYVQYAFMQQLAEIIAIDLRGKYLRALL